MNYETQNTLRQSTTSAGPKPRKAVSAADEFRTVDAKTKRRQRGTKRQTKLCASHHVADAFLRCSFLSKLSVPDAENGKIERDFYKSLSQLLKYYSIEMSQAKKHEYPHNISQALAAVKESLITGSFASGLRLIQQDEKTFLVSEERFHTGYDLYYVPILPLYKMLKDRKSRNIANLLISVCSYLYHIADIPYYREENSFMWYQYEMIGDMQEERREETEELGYTDYDYYKSEIDQAKWVGDQIQKVLLNKYHLTSLEQRVKSFKPKNSFETEVQQLASQALELYKDYPQTSIFVHAPVRKESEYAEEETLRIDKTVSFIATDTGALFEQICEYVNFEFQEYSEQEEPTILRRFNGNPIPDENFDFENRIYGLLHDLIYLLNNFQSSRK